MSPTFMGFSYRRAATCHLLSFQWGKGSRGEAVSTMAVGSWSGCCCKCPQILLCRLKFNMLNSLRQPPGSRYRVQVWSSSLSLPPHTIVAAAAFKNAWLPRGNLQQWGGFQDSRGGVKNPLLFQLCFKWLISHSVRRANQHWRSWTDGTDWFIDFILQKQIIEKSLIKSDVMLVKTWCFVVCTARCRKTKSYRRYTRFVHACSPSLRVKVVAETNDILKTERLLKDSLILFPSLSLSLQTYCNHSFVLIQMLLLNLLIDPILYWFLISFVCGERSTLNCSSNQHHTCFSFTTVYQWAFCLPPCQLSSACFMSASHDMALIRRIDQLGGIWFWFKYVIGSRLPSLFLYSFWLWGDFRRKETEDRMHSPLK